MFRISRTYRNSNIWVRDTAGVKEDVSYVLLREESWLSTAIGKQDQIIRYLPAQKVNYKEKTKENYGMD